MADLNDMALSTGPFKRVYDLTMDVFHGDEERAARVVREAIGLALDMPKPEWEKVKLVHGEIEWRWSPPGFEFRVFPLRSRRWAAQSTCHDSRGCHLALFDTSGECKAELEAILLWLNACAADVG